MNTQEGSGKAWKVSAYIDGRARDATQYDEVRDPFRGNVVGLAPISTSKDCDDALDSARAGGKAIAAMPAYERAALLRRAADILSSRSEQIGSLMSRESGKAIRDAIAEPQRSAETLRLCAEEAVRIQGEHVPMDASAIGAGKIAMTMRFPVGVVAGITPYNGPVHLAAHKLGAAIASGNSIVLKPSPKAPLCVAMLVEAFIEAGAPAGSVNLLFGDEIAPQLVRDPRVDFVSFTGSIPVGKLIRASVGMKPVALELGGVGPTFVHGDADLVAAAKACARNAVMLAGQSCVSVQNVYVQKDVHDRFVDLVCQEMDGIRFGDPMDPSSDVGTMIDEAAAVRVEATIRNAVAEGAKLVRSASRLGSQLGGSILTDVNSSMDIVSKEIFGPAMTVQPYDDIEAAFTAISDSPYGLQCGIFTNSLSLALSAYRSVRTGGVIVNGTSRWRSDQMPYGGVKDSGIGREGPKYAIRDMTEERLLVLNQ
jgi:acyl-CoA reductase-like NAD-dependent aldehyde dehydrogenase